MHADSSYTAATSSSAPPPMQPRHPYPMSPCEAELNWESERQKLRAYIATLPSASFERTKFEEDESFYATFPEARRAAIDRWVAEQFPVAPWADPQVVQYQGPIDLACNVPRAPEPVAAPAPVVAFTTYTLGGALTALSSPPCKTSQASEVLKAQTPPMPAVYYDYSTGGHDVHNSPASVLAADSVFFNDQLPAINGPPPPPPPLVDDNDDSDDDILRTLELLAPARRSGKYARRVQLHSSPRARIIKNPYPSSSPASSRSTLDTPPSSPPSSRSAVSPIVVPSNAPAIQPRYTGDWEADVLAADEYLYAAVNIGNKALSASMLASMSIPLPPLPLLPIEPNLNADIVSIRRHHRHHQQSTHRHRQRPHPYSPPPHHRSRSRSHSHSPSRERSTSAPPPNPNPNLNLNPNKRPKMLRDKNGKPIMACLFCRGRKIACGPPPKGSSDPTCNQCARRGLECQYPTINRRGMRKKKTPVEAHDVASASEASSSPSGNTTSTAMETAAAAAAALELVKIHDNEDAAMSDCESDSDSDGDGDE